MYKVNEPKKAVTIWTKPTLMRKVDSIAFHLGKSRSQVLNMLIIMGRTEYFKTWGRKDID